MANLSKVKDQEPFPQWALIGFILHRNKGKAHQSLSGIKDQTIDNIQRTLRAHSEPGSVSRRAIKRWETNSFHDPYQKTEDILSKAGFTGFYVFFLRPDGPWGICPFQHRTAPPSVIVSGLSQAGEVRQPRD